MAVPGVVGLGAMGGPIAGHMLAAGLEVACLDLNSDLCEHFARRGARVAGSARDLAEHSDVVLVFVPSDDDVLRVCADGLLDAFRPGAVLVICSSVRPDTCQRVRDAAPATSDVLDAALTGGVRGAEQGKINLLVGGDAEVLDRIRPVVAPWTCGVHHLGPLGAGQVGKTVNNLIHWAEISAITEALRLGEAYGLDVPTLRRALMDGTTDSHTLRELDQMRLTWWAKDLDNAVRMGGTVDQDLPVARRAREVMPTITVRRLADLLKVAAGNDI